MFSKQGERVAAEAAALSRAAHPGVVELVGVVDGVLRTRWVEGHRLADLGPLDAEEVAGLAQAVAATLADLHDAGVVHGGLDATHVLVTPAGQPVLCSLGRPGSPADDVAALGRLVTALLAAAPSRPSRRLRRAPSPVRRRPPLGPMLAPPAGPVLAALAAGATDAEPGRRPTARALAAALHDQVPAARLPRPAPPALLARPAPRRPRGPRLAAVAAGVGGSLGLLGLLGHAWAGGGPPPARPAPPGPRPTARPPAGPPGTTPTTGPAVATRVWPPEPVEVGDGVVDVGGARYALGRPGDAVATGDWACTGQRRAVLLRPSTGEVFGFDGWPAAGQVVTGRPLGRVAGATGLRAADTDGDGCHELEVTRAAGPPVRLAVAP